MNHKNRPIHHPTQSLGDVFAAKLGQKFVDQVKASVVQDEEAARRRFRELESLVKANFDHLRKQRHFIPHDWLQKSYPALRVLAGTVCTFDQQRYTRAKTDLEWATRSPEDFQCMLTTIGIKGGTGN